MILKNDPAAERAILAGIYKYGCQGYYEVSDLVSESTLTIDSNQIIFSCLKHIIKKDDKAKFDLPSIYSAANELGLSYVFEKKSELQHLNSIISFPVEMTNLRKFAIKVRKLEIARLYHDALANAVDRLKVIDGSESINDILNIGESAVFEFGNLVSDRTDEPELIGQDLIKTLDELENNVKDQIGISTGYERYDFAIGGGLREATINVIAARMKVGKSFLAVNIGKHISQVVGVPVLYLDTEMTKEDQIPRVLAMLSGVKIHDIETGKFKFNPEDRKALYQKAKELEKTKFFYKNIGGRSPEEILALMRRWLFKSVGINSDGRCKPCVIVYDYIKLMSSAQINNNVAEHQALGFWMTQLQDFNTKYRTRILTFAQLNRDGINKEDTDAVGASDRIGMYCSNLSIYKKKSDEEIATDGPENGNRKLIPIICRHGEGLQLGEYINMHFKGSIGRIVEGKTNLEIQSGVKSQKGEVFVTETNDNLQEEIFGPE